MFNLVSNNQKYKKKQNGINLIYFTIGFNMTETDFFVFSI